MAEHTKLLHKQGAGPQQRFGGGGGMMDKPSVWDQDRPHEGALERDIEDDDGGGGADDGQYENRGRNLEAGAAAFANNARANSNHHVHRESERQRLLDGTEDDPPEALLFMCCPSPDSWTQAFCVCALATVLTILATALVGSAGNNKYAPSTFVQRVTYQQLYDHLHELNATAASTPDGPPSRSVLYGFNRSAAYVEAQLEPHRAGLTNVTRQYFEAPVWEDRGNHTMTVASGSITLHLHPYVEFQPLRFSGGTGDPISAVAVNFDGAACTRAAFAAASGKVAVVPDTSTCSNLYQRARAAQQAGAVAMVVYREQADAMLPNERVRDPTWAYNASVPFVQIPVVGVVHLLAAAVADGVQVNMTVNAASAVVETFNLLAVRQGTLPYAVVVGAHLDSVPRGPGINDNGSGAAVVLAMAQQIARFNLRPTLTVIFAFWGAAEEGLLGSGYFVSKLNSSDTPVHEPVIANINVDTLASPNYARFVYEGSLLPPGTARAGSIFLQQQFEAYFSANLEAFEYMPFVTKETDIDGSDYLPFFLHGIAVGGVTAGTTSLKNIKQRSQFGGLSGVPFDPCFHRACDTFENVNMFSLLNLGHATAYVTWQAVGSRALVDALNMTDTTVLESTASTSSHQAPASPVRL